MPEQISKYPDVTLKVLKDLGAVCGEGAPQEILTQCPAKRFCSLPTGELCIYGIDEIPQMTQIKLQELAKVVAPGNQQSDTNLPAIFLVGAIVLGVVFLVGLVLGSIWQKARFSRSRSRD
ncbi:MAG TPA: hypothetical protein VGO51_17480 [Burkholderiaceae bacterium]|jgi:hypothetical protein|nr:hypothetical protein [Burkholderiaceae bacterium]